MTTAPLGESVMQCNTFDFLGVADYTDVIQAPISEAETPIFLCACD
jgi:hypothetical protein